MGLIIDSSVLVAAERQGKNARNALTDISAGVGDQEIAISVLSLMELAHGAARANTAARRSARLQFIEELMVVVPTYPVSVSLALRAGQLNGENESRGIRIPLVDLLIALTALELGFSVATANIRHFEQVRGLSIVRI